MLTAAPLPIPDNGIPVPNKAFFRLTADAIDAIGTAEFPLKLANICRSISSYDSLVIYAFIDKQLPEILFDNLDETDNNTFQQPYLEGAYLLDPFYALFRQRAENGLYRLCDIAPDDFHDSEYFHNFYQATQLTDEASVVLSCNEQVQIHLSLGVRDPSISIGDKDLQTLTQLVPLIVALSRRHWPTVVPGKKQATGRMGAHLENAFQRFGSSLLSAREAEIAKLVLMGHSSKSIARVLDISPETVKVYRKRMHSKLGINSQAELFSLFIRGLRNTSVGVNDDPLISVFKQTPQ